MVEILEDSVIAKNIIKKRDKDISNIKNAMGIER